MPRLSMFRLLAVVPLAVGLLGACSAAPDESTASTTSDLDLVGRPVSPVKFHPAAPPWPVPNGTYCPAFRPTCTITVESYQLPASGVLPAVDSQLQALGCTPPLFLSGDTSGVITAYYALCFDTPAVRASFAVAEGDVDLCSACMPEPPAGQIYVYTGPESVGPNCPDGCPHQVVTRGSGTTTAE